MVYLTARRGKVDWLGSDAVISRYEDDEAGYLLRRRASGTRGRDGELDKQDRRVVLEAGR